MGYAVFFDRDNETYRTPTNPSEISVSKALNVETYNVLKSGQVAVPTDAELTKISFECEFPSKAYSYVNTKSDFKDCDIYEKFFGECIKNKYPVRFIARNGIGSDINMLVLIESLDVVEKAGEEGDKYFSFELIEYKEYGVLKVVASSGVAKNETSSTNEQKKNTSQTTYVVKKGDTLWAIAKKYYNSGSKYTTIFNANKDKLKNPNLIYPGQKLVIP